MDGLEREFEGELKVVRLNIQDTVGQEMGRKYRFEYTPTFIFIDNQGEEVWRSVGVINPNEIRDLMSEE